MKGKKVGGAGYRSRYLSHAKRALYHLSYAPTLEYFCLNLGNFFQIANLKLRKVIGV